MPTPLHNGQAGAPVGDVLQQNFGDTHGNVNSYSHRISTLDELLAKAQTDLTVWEVEKHVLNSWEVGAKHPETGQILVEPLFQVKAWLKRRQEQASDTMEEVLESFAQRLQSKAKPAYPKPKKPRSKERFCQEISIPDLHLGKLAWGKETGDADWDLTITQSAFLDALHAHLDWYADRPVEQILLPAGNDFWQIDTILNSTTAGTIVDVDSRWPKGMEIGCDLMIQAVRLLLERAPVHIVMVPGNHDEQRVAWLGRVLKEAFNSSKHVTIDRRPENLKAFEYGCNLIGFAHGKNEKPARLMGEMPRRWPQEWARTRHREWHIGHLHKKASMLMEGDEEQQLRIRIIPSLCPPDAFHSENLFYSVRASESYLWSKAEGYAAHHSHRVG